MSMYEVLHTMKKNITSNTRYGVTNMLSIQTQKIFIVQYFRTIIEETSIVLCILINPLTELGFTMHILKKQWISL